MTKKYSEGGKEIYYAYRQRKRDAGICLYGGCWEKTEKSYCRKHMALGYIQSNIRRKARSAARPHKPCVVCGGPTQNRYCCQRCAGFARRRIITLTCHWCGVNFERFNRDHNANQKAKKTQFNYCSPSHKGKGIWFQIRNSNLVGASNAI